MVHILATIMIRLARALPQKAIYAYPWALGDLGVESALDELQGVGIDGLQLALSYHVASYLTPRNPRRRLVAGDLGSVWFDYLAGVPDGWPVRPKVREDAAIAVPQVLRMAGERGMQVIGWLVYLYNHDLASRYPELTVHNAFGDASFAQLCPANPIVREYSVRLTEAALATGTMTGLHAESLSFLPWGYGLIGLKSTVMLSDGVQNLLGLCFCEHCRLLAKTAGLDVERLVRATRSMIDEALSEPGLHPGAQGYGRATDEAGAFAGGWPAAGQVPGIDVGFLEDLAAYRDVRAVATESLNVRVAEVVDGGIRFSTTATEPDTGRMDGDVAKRLRPAVDEVRVRVAAGTGVGALVDGLARALSGCRDGTGAFAQYRIQDFRSQAEFLESIEAAVAAGIRSHRFYEYSVLTDQHVGWLKAAAHRIEALIH